MWFIRGGAPDHEDEDDERNVKAMVGAFLVVAALGLSKADEDDEDDEE